MLRGERGQRSCCSPVPFGKEGRCHLILDSNAWLHVGFKEMTLRCSGRDSELGEPNLS